MARKKQKRSDGQYEIKIIVGRDSTGKAIRKSFYSSKTVAEARRKAEAYIQSQKEQSAAAGEPVKRSETFVSWAAEWLETYKEPYVSAATYRSTYSLPVNNYMIPYFGTRQLRDITQADVQKYFSEITHLSKSTLNKHHFILAAIFETAIENDLCEKNPVRHIRYASTKSPTPKKALTDEQMQRLERIASERNRPEIIVLLHTGLRRGELCGLQWGDIDMEARTLTVSRAIAQSSAACLVNPPKFESYRTIPLDDVVLRLLEQTPKRALWVFPARTGGYRRPDKWSDILEKFMQDVPSELQCTSHELRHTYGTYLRRHDVDIYTIQKILGHKDINVTAGIYVHADVDAMRAEILEKTTTDLRQKNAIISQQQDTDEKMKIL